MRILISGASGFLGTRLRQQLKEHQVRALSRKEFLLPSDKLKKVIETFNPQYIIHLAAYGNHYYQQDVREIYKANVNGTLNLLEASNGVKYKAFINIGTSSEYGKKNKPMKETDLLEPETFYAASKSATTYLCKVWAEQYNKPIVTLRPFSLYGPKEADFRFIPTIMKCIIDGKILKLSPGVHDWIYIDDFIEALMLVAKNAKRLKGQVVNIGTGKQYTNKQVVELAQNLSSQGINYKEVKKRGYDTTRKWIANNKKIRKLGWKPKTSLIEGLREIITYYLPM